MKLHYLLVFVSILLASLSITACKEFSGGCDKNCDPGYACKDGSCQPIPLNQNTIVACQGKMIYPYSDPNHCGKCGNVCGNGQYCEAGTCAAITSSSTIACNGQTVHLYSDSANCGKCGNICGTSESCVAGVCKFISSSTFAIGDIVTFGSYEQDNDPTNGPEPITWRVLDKNEEGQYLIISEKALDSKPYHTRNYTSWEWCTIRSWLNGYDASYNTARTDFHNDNFIDAAFTVAEQAQIVAANVPAHANPAFHSSPGNATTDKIFLLSMTEAQKYFTSTAARQASATPYAIAQGAFYEKQSDTQECHWWLRTPGVGTNRMTFVRSVGTMDDRGDYIDSHYIAVRPALWVNL